MEHSWQRRIKDLTLISLVLGASVGTWWFFVADRDGRVCVQRLDSYITPDAPSGSNCRIFEAGVDDDYLY
ncbi:MAG: hypothetical protein F6J87_29105 [Spirulina sp. SIO3F2]|nr:hypothetical protein [Spirulina sp. SIO3F2]